MNDNETKEGIPRGVKDFLQYRYDASLHPQSWLGGILIEAIAKGFKMFLDENKPAVIKAIAEKRELESEFNR